MPTDPLWTDYVSALGALLGVLMAGAALVIALRSAADASRSAESAERTSGAAEASAAASEATLHSATAQLELARAAHEQAEADRARRPVVERIELSEITPQPGEVAPVGTFRVGFKNSGDKTLSNALLTILLDSASFPELTDRWGRPTGESADDDTRERWPGVDGLPRTFAYIARFVDVQIGLSLVRYVRITRRGRFPLRVKLFHSELAAGGPWIDAALDIDADGTTTIDYLPTKTSPGALEGRCADFERAGVTEGSHA